MKKSGLLLVLIALLVCVGWWLRRDTVSLPAAADQPQPLATALPQPTAPSTAHTFDQDHEQAPSSLPQELRNADDIRALLDHRAVTHTAVTSGPWSDPRTWADGRVPVAGARVYLPEGVEVLLDFANDTHLKALYIDGAMVMSHQASTQLVVDTILVTELGRFQAGTPEQPVRDGVEALVSILPYYEPNESPVARTHGAMFYALGQVTMHGQQKSSFVPLRATPRPGDHGLSLGQPPTNWQAGDMLAVAGNRLPRDQGDTLVVGEITGGTVTIKTLDDRQEGIRGDYQPEPGASNIAINLSRNVGISSAPPTGTAGVTQGAMLFYGDAVAKASLHNVGAYGLGMQEGNHDGIGTEQTRPAISFIAGGQQPASISGLAMVDAPESQLSTTGSRVSVTNSVAYDYEGGAWLTENGSPSRLYWSGKRPTPAALINR